MRATLLLCLTASPVPDNCVQCFEEDLGGGFIFYGCEGVPGYGAEKCHIGIANPSCLPLGTCIKNGPLRPSIEIGPAQPGPMDVIGVDAALTYREAWNLPATAAFLIEYSQSVFSGTQPDPIQLSTKNPHVWYRWLDADAPQLFRVRWDGETLDVQEVLLSVPKRAAAVGYRLTSKTLALYVARPDEGGDGVEVRVFNVDDVGTLPFK